MGSLPGGQLLQGPGIAIRVAEGDEGTPRLNVDIAGLHAVREQIPPRRLYIGDDDLHAFLRARRHLRDAGAHHDGTR